MLSGKKVLVLAALEDQPKLGRETKDLIVWMKKKKKLNTSFKADTAIFCD